MSDTCVHPVDVMQRHAILPFGCWTKYKCLDQFFFSYSSVVLSFTLYTVCFLSQPFNFVRDVLIYVFKLLVIKFSFVFFRELFVRFRFGNIRGILVLSKQMIYALTQSIFRCDVF